MPRPTTERSAGRARDRATPWAVAVAVVAALLAASVRARPGGFQDVAAPEATHPPSRPDVVVVLANDLDLASLAAFDTPVFDALTARARVFGRHHVDPGGLSTRFALQFGAYGVREGLADLPLDAQGAPSAAPPERITVAEALRLANYTTLFLGLWGLSPIAVPEPAEVARLHGYDHWRAGLHSVPHALAAGTENAWGRIDDGVLRIRSGDATLAAGDAFANVWGRATERPRFAFVALVGPGRPCGLVPQDRLVRGGHVLADGGADHEAAVRSFDDALGRIVSALDLERAVLIVTSDGVAPRTGSSGDGAADLAARVEAPLLVVGAGVVPGRSDRLTHAVDVPATVLELAGLGAPPFGFEDAVSFAADLAGEASERGPVLSHERVRSGSANNFEERWCAVDAAGNRLLSNGEDAPPEFVEYAGAKAVLTDDERTAARERLERFARVLTR